MQILSTDYQQFIILTPTGIPLGIQPKGHPNTRFSLLTSKELWLFRDFHKKKTFYVPANMIDLKEKSKNIFDAKRSKQILMIMKTIVINRNECWIWAGAKRGGYPSVAFNGKMRGAMKTLLYWLTNHLMDEVKVDKLCETDFCINPAHYSFNNFPFNIPRDPELLEHAMGISRETADKDRLFWTTDEVLPWQHLQHGARTLLSQEELSFAKPIHQELIMDENGRQRMQEIGPTKEDDFRTFFKITPSGDEATNHAENDMQKNS